MFSRKSVSTIALCATGVVVTAAHGGDAPPLSFHTPSAYKQLSDSPWAVESSMLIVEDFEDGLLNATGLSADAGNVREPSLYTDSVDIDDGVIDGWGREGHSFLTTDGPGGITFSFDSDDIGGYPTLAGLVWTDGNWASTLTLEVFDADGISLGSEQYVLGDENDGTGQTDEDRLLGAEYEGGISAIRVTTEFGGIEVDHVQYGFGPIPTPGSLALLALAGGIIGRRRRRR